MNKITFVTALLDIKREDLESPSFNRPFAKYLNNLGLLLRKLEDTPLVIYIDEDIRDFVLQNKPNNTEIKYISTDDLKNTEYYENIQKIRENPEWYNQVGWLKESTQAKLEFYNPLIYQKIHFLEETANENLFNSDYFVWIDAGIANAQMHPGYLSKDWFEARLTPHLQKFLFLCFPYKGHSEVHGFKREALHEYAGEEVTRVARATFFGGTADDVQFFSKKFRELARETLKAGFMGTEESIYTLLTYLYPDRINRQTIPGHGLIWPFFEDLQNDPESRVPWFGEGSFLYKGLKTAQNPKAPYIFRKLFEKYPDIDLLIELGTGKGGLALYLKELCNEFDTKFITIDLHDRVKKIPEFNSIDFRIQNCQDEEVIQGLGKDIQEAGRTVVLCDNGNKKIEFNLYAPLLKRGDIIMGHDFARDKDTFVSKIKNKVWNWFELEESHIKKVCEEHSIVEIMPEFNDVAWTCRQKGYKRKTDLYVITYNSPVQFEALVESINAACPQMLEHSDLYVVNNTDIDKYFPEYEELFKKYGFKEFRKGNLGICGGRQFIAEHFDTTDSEYMFFFEDDMFLVEPEFEGEVCKNGFRKYYDNLYPVLIDIISKNRYDFLKLSFTEFFNKQIGNQIQWAWYNVPEEVRSKRWPNNKLPKKGYEGAPLLDFKNIQSEKGLAYADGEVYYCNWPHIISKEGSKKIFLDTKWKFPHEQTWMSNTYKRTLKGEIRSAVLLASLINHNRFHHYEGQRKES